MKINAEIKGMGKQVLEVVRSIGSKTFREPVVVIAVDSLVLVAWGSVERSGLERGAAGLSRAGAIEHG